MVIDWNGDTVSNTSSNLNVNFDGVFGPPPSLPPAGTQTLGALNEDNDWARIPPRSEFGAASNAVVRRLEGGPEDPNGVPTLVPGDSLGGDSLGGDSLGGDSLGGDSLGGDSLGGDSLGGDSLGGDSLGGDSLGGDSLGGDSLGGDSLGGDSLGGDSLGGGELDASTNRGMGRGETRAFDACILGGIPPTLTDPGQDGCTGPWFDNDGIQHNAQPNAGDAFYHKIYLTWFEPTSEPVDFYALTRTGGGVTTPYTLQAEESDYAGWRPRQLGGNRSATQSTSRSRELYVHLGANARRRGGRPRI